jgi:hypothetical protein
MVDKLTSLTFLAYIGTGKNTKSRAKVMPHINRGRQFFEDRLGVPKAKQRFLRDAGGEFSPDLPGHVLKLGPSVEARNSFAQRIVHRLMQAKRGNLKEVTQQAQDIMNNTKSRVSKMTPNDAAAKEQASLAGNYNASRTVGKPTQESKLKVGDKVRIVTKKTKVAIYKAYQGKQWSSEKYPIMQVGKTKPYRYKLTLHKFVKKERVNYNVWKYRDQISNAEMPEDKESEKRLAKLTPTGKIKAIPQPKGPKKPVPNAPPPKIRRSKRVLYQQPLPEIIAVKVPKKLASKKLTAEQQELKDLHFYVKKETRDYKSYDKLPPAKAEKRLKKWNRNIARMKVLLKKKIRYPGMKLKRKK